VTPGLVGGPDGVDFPARDDGEERAVADDRDDPRKRPDRGLVEVLEAGGRRRRVENSGMQHGFEGEVVHEGRPAQNLRRQVDAREFASAEIALGGGLRPRKPGDLLAEIDFLGERPVAEVAVAPFDEDAPVVDAEVLDPRLEEFGRLAEQRVPGRRGGEPDGGAPGLHRARAGGHPLIGRRSGVAGDEVDPRRVDVELVGRDLDECGVDPLADLDLARAQVDPAIGPEPQPLVDRGMPGDRFGQVVAAHRPASGPTRLA
jgi:hypothetical protein